MSRKLKKYKKKNVDGNYIALKNEIIKSKNIKTGLSQFKALSSDDELLKYVYRLNNEYMYKNYISGAPFPSNLADLGKKTPLFVIDNLDRELYWYTCILRIYTKEINQFIIYQDKFTKLLITGDYLGANKTLNEIKEKFGYSLWFIENKIAIIEASNGFEKQKEYTNKISQDENNGLFVRLFSKYFSIRAEKNVSNNKYNSIIEQAIQDYKLKQYEEFSQYFGFKSNFFGTYELKNVNAILFFESANSIIDRYLTFIRICQFICTSNSFTNHISSIKKALNLLYLKINDNNIENLAYFVGLKNRVDKNEISAEIIKAMDFYTTGSYKECVSVCEHILNKNPCIIDIYEIFVKSAVRLNIECTLNNDESYLNKILLCMFNIVTKNSCANESSNEILKIVFVNSSLNLTAKLLAFLIREYFYYNRDTMSMPISFGLINSYLHNPILGTVIRSSDFREKYFSNLALCYKSSETLWLQYAICNNDIDSLTKYDLPKDRQLKYMAYIYMNLEKYSKATDIFKKILENTNVLIFEQEALIGLIRCYIHTNNFNDCFDLIVDTYLQNDNMIYKFPLNELVNVIDSDYFDISSNISIPIICDLYSRYISSDKDYVRTITYEDFLNYHGLNKPSELNNCLDKFDVTKLIYFLRYICVSHVMDSSIAFNSSEEVEKERISICQILRIIDKQNSKEYFEEIKNITQKLMISKGLREVENSKIYVDVEGIKKSIEKDMRESFKRYIHFLSNSIYNDEPDYITVRSTQYEGMEVKIPSNEKYGLFNTMFLELRNNFVSSNKYGLDCYLSVGIRHGTLSGQIRSQFEFSHLITQKDNETNIYYKNDYWAHEFRNANQITINEVMEYLAEFSKRIDELIDLLKNKWIQIRTEEKNPYGLFNYIITIDESEEMMSKITTETTYEEFIEMIFQKLWEKTEANLCIVRLNIIFLKSEFNRVFEDLQRNLELLKDEIDLTGIYININNSKISTQYELDKIANWFKRARTTKSEDYLIELPINIALEMIKNIYPSNDIKTDILINKDSILKGKTLKSMVDVFYILFDNIIKHSQLDFNNNVKINISLTDEIMEILIENDINKKININKEMKKLNKIKEFMGKDLTMDKVKKEGGTGFYKIEKILSIDLNCSNDIDFEVTTEHIFKVYILVDMGVIKV